MSGAKLIAATVKSTPHIALFSVNLLWIYLTLGYRVRKTRNAFEKQLIIKGMSKKDAKQLSANFENLKNEITGTLKQLITSRIR